MFDTIKKILDAKLKVSRGIVKRRKRYRNTYNPEEVKIEYLDEEDADGSF